MKQQKKDSYDIGYWDASKEFSEKFDQQREHFEEIIEKAKYLTAQNAGAPLELQPTPGQFECVKQL